MSQDTVYSPVKRHDRLSIQVADQIQDLILSKHLSLGTRLPAEPELCERLGVSRSVVREAIRALEAKGLHPWAQHLPRRSVSRRLQTPALTMAARA